MNYIDLHCDTISELMHKENLSLLDAPLQINIKQLKEGNCLLQCFAMFVYLKKTPEPFKYCIQMINRYYEEIERYKDKIAPVLCYSDLAKNQVEGKISSLLTIEEGGVTESSLAYLRTFHKLGVRMICLNWNFENGVGHPNFKLTEHPDFKTPNTKEGLTEYGIEMVKEMNRLGMIVDVSHLSDKGFYDCLKYSSKPIVASHSNARGVCNHVRNLTDDMILKLKENGGVMGMNFCAAFLNENEEVGKNTIPCVIEHIKYIKNLAGIDVIAIGSDFDGIDPNIQMKNASLMPKLFEEMRTQGFTEEEIERVAYRNFLRVLGANIG
ncbi:MAG: dipeptidase [Roseburia sp.]|nr:dipeptidase [Anaeroplasma bactoclasticum]MCM1196829.1 dipeptidase [Roseburia sp.]MCM1557432.1 dipeptidase [Anaeroplasma bactoclasticum]